MTYWFHPEVQGTVKFAQNANHNTYIDVSLQTYGGVWMKAIDESSWTWEVGMNMEDKFSTRFHIKLPMRFTRAHKGHTQVNRQHPDSWSVSLPGHKTTYIVNGEEKETQV